jgi:hypothetical protein
MERGNTYAKTYLLDKIPSPQSGEGNEFCEAEERDEV